MYVHMYRGPGGYSGKRVSIKGPSVNRTIFVALHLILQYGVVHNPYLNLIMIYHFPFLIKEIPLFDFVNCHLY